MPGFATNGLNLIGFGAESVLMGGADLAVARDTSAINTNPAGLAQTEQRAFDNYLAVAYALDVSHADRFGNDALVDNEVVPLGNFGYAQRVGDLPLTVGVGLFAQGGAGFVYEELNTPFGGRDELSVQFRVAKLGAGLAWQVNEQWRLGASIATTYADIEQRFFPRTSVADPAAPQRSFFGQHLDDAYTVRPSFRFGAQYKLNDRATLGLAYAPETDLPLKNGEFVVDFTAAGLGPVTYADTRLSGLALPQEFGAGLALNATDHLLLAFELTWLNWDGALNAATLTARNPDDPNAPRVLENTARLDWQDQFVFALGAAFEISDRMTLRAGYNYGRNPIPEETTSPLLATISEHHIMAGMSRLIGNTYELHAGLEYVPPNRVTYNNPQLPFGPGAEERTEFIAAHLMLSRRW